MLDSRTCLQIVDDGCFCESCFTYNDNDPQYTAIDKCSYTTCGAAQKLAQPCTSANPCSMTDCAAFCTANVEFDDGVVECSHFFSMISGGCILYYGCDSDRTTGETGSTYAKNWEETTNPMNAPDKPTTTPDPSESCEGRCGGGDDERDHLDWCSCSPTCDDYVNAQECCDDYEEMCPITLPPTTTTPDPYPGNWNDWGDCSVTCGTGKKFRTCDTGIEQQCLGDAASTCHAGACPVETASTTTDAAPKNSCVARCGDDPSDDSNVDDCICTDVCQQTFVPNECCNDYYARCVGDHQNGGDLIDPNEGIESNVSPYPDQGLERGTTDEPEESEDNTAFYIIGGVLGGVVVLILIVLIVRCCAAKRAKDKHVVAGGLSGHAVTYPNVEMQHVSSRPSDRHDFMTI